jgi:UTP--glucose-1-phosphate uridylyltransferase
MKRSSSKKFPKKVTKGVIPAAGLGTRFLPQTKAMPKEMMPVVDKPIIQYVVEECVSSGITDIIIVTGYHKRSIEDHFDAPLPELVNVIKNSGKKKMQLLEEADRISKMANFVYIRQKGGYGNATPVRNARSLIGNEPFAVLWGDEFVRSDPPRLKQCLKVFYKYKSPVISGIKIDNKQALSKYGIAVLEHVEGNVHLIKKIVEKPDPDKAPSQIATHGCYILTPDIFNILEKQKPGTGGEYYLAEAIDELRKSGRKIYACEIKDCRYYDTGDKQVYLEAAVEYGLRHPEVGKSFERYLKKLNLD